ncbi:outer membrane protein assembly factor BamC [Lacisediminimonas sp.]|uniref:outer membrane protein assembly factor BamC n=1 Tax=Lacisediminimonas sp. TaxID=3060582 RepID=UPI00271D8EF8|nr:outer membrane protein assembly factor BamC [Lacisediminimonas sp.]MDO8298452.1 outer membrane protein assembly factor BamC [Lacisediminimonas sp.]
MINRRNTSAASRAGLSLLYTLMLAGVAGCSSVQSSFGTLFEGEKIDYKSAGKRPTATLEVPPDLTQLQKDNRYSLPDASRGTATASGLAANRGTTGAPVTAVAPKAAPDMRIERDGNQRWLVVKKTPEELWPQLKDFWQEAGFLINIEQPDTGIMETEWAENRARIPQDIIRRTVGRAFDSIYSTGERDKFRTRLERRADGWTEVFISHRGAKEVMGGVSGDNTVWTPQPANPELEAEFTSKLMARLGNDEVKAKQEIARAAPMSARSKIVRGSGSAYVEVNEGFERAWRRVGLALDRVGFTVEDRDRTKGTYFVRYVDQAEDAKDKDSKKGIISRLFSFGSKDDKAKAAQRYRVLVKASGDSSQVAVLNSQGLPETSVTADRILSLLNDQLK